LQYHLPHAPDIIAHSTIFNGEVAIIKNKVQSAIYIKDKHLWENFLPDA